MLSLMLSDMLKIIYISTWICRSKPSRSRFKIPLLLLQISLSKQVAWQHHYYPSLFSCKIQIMSNMFIPCDSSFLSHYCIYNFCTSLIVIQFRMLLILFERLRSCRLQNIQYAWMSIDIVGTAILKCRTKRKLKISTYGLDHRISLARFGRCLAVTTRPFVNAVTLCKSYIF